METAPRDRRFDLNANKSRWGCPRPVRLRRVIECSLKGQDCGLWRDGRKGKIYKWGFELGSFADLGATGAARRCLAGVAFLSYRLYEIERQGPRQSRGA